MRPTGDIVERGPGWSIARRRHGTTGRLTRLYAWRVGSMRGVAPSLVQASRAVRAAAEDLTPAVH